MTSATPDPSPTTPRILVVDPDERVRESLAGLISIGERCIVVGSAGHPAEALAFVRAHAPDVVVLDPRLPDLAAGATLISDLRASAPHLCVVVMTSDPEGHLGITADAIVRKTFRPRELIEAICQAAIGIAH
jgi:DNA-binding NarL/FixJ family response regulator